MANTNSHKVKEVSNITATKCNKSLISEEENFRNSENTLEKMDLSKVAWNSVLLARHCDRPTTFDYIDSIFDDFFELHGDKLYADDKSIIGGLALFENKPLTVIGVQKGRNIDESIMRNFGMPHPEGYRKALRLMKQAERFDRPVVCFIDTPGAYPGIGAEERGQSEAIARNLIEMCNLSVPIISIIIGEGGSGGALALAVANEVWMLEHSIYSILSPEGFSSILWKDSTRAEEAATLMKLTAKELFEYKIIEEVIEESPGGIHINPEFSYSIIKKQLKSKLSFYRKLTSEEIINQRKNKFRSYK